MHVTIGTSIPGAGVVGKRAYFVNLMPKKLTIKIPKGRDDIALPLVLTANGTSST